MRDIETAIAAARRAAAETVDAAVPATVEGRGPSASARPSMMTVMAQANLRPDRWLKVSEYGLFFGKEKSRLIPEIVVRIDLTEDVGFWVKEQVKFGNPAQYFSTYDGRSCDKGGAWESAVARAMAFDPEARPYVTVDVKAALAQPVRDRNGEPFDLPVDAVVGIALSYSGFFEWQAMFRSAVLRGLVREEGHRMVGDTALFRLRAKTIDNHVNTWGVIEFELLDGIAPASTS